MKTRTMLWTGVKQYFNKLKLHLLILIVLPTVHGRMRLKTNKLIMQVTALRNKKSQAKSVTRMVRQPISVTYLIVMLVYLTFFEETLRLNLQQILV